MKLLNLLALALLALGAYAEFIIHPPVVYPDVPAYVAPTYPVIVVAHVLDATDFVAHIKVIVTNNAIPTTMNVTATVNYQRWGLDEEVSSTPLTISILHPIEVKGINLSFPADWICTTPFVPFSLLDGQQREIILNYAKVQVKL